MTIDTPITRLLEQKGISFRLLPHDEPVFTVEAAAAQRGVVLEEMVKSILLQEKGSDRFVMACVIGSDRLRVQAVRRTLPGSWKRLRFATDEQIREIAGAVRGAVAPLALPADVPIVFDEAIQQSVNVNISSGDPMAGIELAAVDLIRLAGPVFGRIGTWD